MSHAFWGGRFNPILVVDREEEARRLVDLFRVDVIWPIGDSEEVKAFPKKFPYLINPLFHKTLFIGGANERKHSLVLDVHNELEHLRDTPEWRDIKAKGIRLYTWQANDPLSDVFLVQFGAYPDVQDTGIDYRTMLSQAAEAGEHGIDEVAAIPADVLDHPSIAYMARHGLRRHYTIRTGRDSPGFFVGSASNVDDLVCHWNLRACDIPLWFVDPSHLSRYTDVIPAWEKAMRELVQHRHEWNRHLAMWTLRDNVDEAAKPFGNLQLMRSHVSEYLWNGLNVVAPLMHFGTASVLGVVGLDSGKPKVSFALSDKPFSGDTWFHQQHLVASVSFVGGLYGDERHTFDLPYVPELNEFYARTVHFHYNRLRVEPERIGVVIDAVDHDSFLYALPVDELFERVFAMAGYKTKLSSGGLITRQLIARLGGLQSARVFKIPGVRRLLRTHGPTAAFTKKSALELIGSKDPNNPDAKFSDREDLYIEQRPMGTKLDPGAVFEYLVEKGLFRIGAELTCLNCRMTSWTALDVLKQKIMCDLCGQEYDATRQLVKGTWHYRRSGLLGAEKNAQGAIPVALTLQQLGANVHGLSHDGAYSPSLDLEPKAGSKLPKCEIDFLWIYPRSYPDKTQVILGECKDQGPIPFEEFRRDVENLRRVAEALPRERFETYVVLSKLAPFTREEIELAKTLNTEYERRAILLTARELEPYHIFDRAQSEVDRKHHGGSPEDLAAATAEMYFQEQ